MGDTVQTGPAEEMLSFEELAERREKREKNLERINAAVEFVERELSLLVHDHLYSRLQPSRDITLVQRMRGLVRIGIQPHHLGNVDQTSIEKSITLSKEWKEFETSHVRAKLDALVAIFKNLNDTDDLDNSYNADELFPAVLWSLLRNQPAHLASGIDFIKIVLAEPLSGIEAYILTSLDAACAFLETVDPKTLSNDLESFQPNAMNKFASNLRSSIGELSDTISTNLSSNFGSNLFKRNRPSYGELVNPRWMTIQAKDMTLGEVDYLLKDYRQLVEYIGGNNHNTGREINETK